MYGFTVSDPVENLTASFTHDSGSFSISISWSEPIEPNGVILRYNYTVFDTETTTELLAGSTESTSVVVTMLSGVEPFTNYTVGVFAVNSAGGGQDSTITSLSPETGMRSFHPWSSYRNSVYASTLSISTYLHYNDRELIIGCSDFRNVSRIEGCACTLPQPQVQSLISEPLSLKLDLFSTPQVASTLWTLPSRGTNLLCQMES